ncbi:MAG TPA: ABC transporter substrate-binding protein [Clostridia bacterium]|nr:ABC transporter substrate-binding protein [Clostridia bacterium]
MQKKLKVYLALALACVLTMGFVVGCVPKETEVTPTEAPVETPAESQAPVNTTPLVVAYDTFSEKFSPFFADTGYDMDAVAMTQIAMLTTDRMGGIIYNAIEGETVSYNGTDYTYTGPCDVSVKYDEAANITTYTIKMREDIVFSDGDPADADDIIFTYYVYADPAYVGSTTLTSYDIIGLKNYQTQTTDAIYTKYSDLFEAIYAAGADHAWASTDTWAQDQQTALWDDLKAEWISDVQAISDYVVGNYLNDEYAASVFAGKTAADVTEDMYIAFSMAMWNFAAVNEDGTLTGNGTGTVYDLATALPTVEDMYNEAVALYAGDPAAYWGTENGGDVDGTDVLGTVKARFITAQASTDPEMAGGVPNISGIKKLDQYTVEVKTNGYSAPAVYTICGLNITPLHYYGDVAQYNYDNNQFGHPYNDLSIVQAKTTQPMGAGPYKFIKYENRVIYYEANPLYFKGAPKTTNIQFKETATGEVAAALAAGTADMGEMAGSKSNFAEVAGYNPNGETTGEVITTIKVDNLGYGYIGMNADTVNVGGQPNSEASKNLRKALATVLAVYRDVAYDSYYGEAASVIQYPISNTSWAAPQPTDEGYKIAFSTDVTGAPIYTADMTADQKYTAAVEAAKGYLIAAGFTFDEATGLFTAAPEGAKLSYEVIIPGGGNGEHPSFAVLTDASNALATIGIELKINDPADSNVLWNSLDAGTQELWCAAWGATIDPDMYQVYHSSGIVGKGGSDSNHYHINVPELDQLIVDARLSDDQAYRKAIYKQALDIIVDMAVEIPAYQRQNCTVVSSERVVVDSLTPDITTFWLWIVEPHIIEMQMQ